jgi:uncharacterized membrane protein YjfL (UPF0719 family)
VEEENNMKKIIMFALFLMILPGAALAAAPEIIGDKLFDGILATFIYGIVGIIMAAISFKALDCLTPGDLKKQLTEEKNLALAVVVGLQALGISIIIAAAIAG